MSMPDDIRAEVKKALDEANGDIDKAIEILDQLLTMPGVISVNLLRKDPAWEKLWDRDEFNKLLSDYF